MATVRYITNRCSTHANGTKISGFETFKFDANAGTQDMSLMTNVFTNIYANAATTTFSNVASSTTHLFTNAASTAATTFTRLIDGTANSLTIAAKANTAFTGSITANNEETITIDSNDGTFEVGGTDGALAASDLTTINITGDNNVDLVGDNGSGGGTADQALSSTIVTTIASTLTGTATLNVSAVNSTSAITFTAGTSTGTSTVVTGSGADTVTAGSGIISITSGAGDDTINGGALGDTITSEGGADTINAGAGGDTITGGGGIDTIDVGAGDAASDTVVMGAGTSASRDIISNFLVGATANNDIIETGTGTDPTEAIAAASDVQTENGTGNVTVATAATGLLLIGANMSGSFGGTGTLDGTNLLAALNGTLTVAAANEKFIAAIDNGTDTGIYYADAGTGNTGVVASEMTLIAVISGLSDATTLTAANFTT